MAAGSPGAAAAVRRAGGRLTIVVLHVHGAPKVEEAHGRGGQHAHYQAGAAHEPAHRHERCRLQCSGSSTRALSPSLTGGADGAERRRPLRAGPAGRWRVGRRRHAACRLQGGWVGAGPPARPAPPRTTAVPPAPAAMICVAGRPLSSSGRWLLQPSGSGVSEGVGPGRRCDCHSRSGGATPAKPPHP